MELNKVNVLRALACCCVGNPIAIFHLNYNHLSVNKNLIQL